MNVRAADLPVGSVVATDSKAWIKKWDNVERVPYWIGAETYAWPFGNAGIDDELRTGAVVLRVGTGQEQP